MHNNDTPGKNWVYSISGQPVYPQTPQNKTPVPHEKTVREELEEQAKLLEERRFRQQAQQTPIPDSYYNQQSEQFQNVEWINKYIPQNKISPVNNSLNQSKILPEQLQSSLLPPYISATPQQLPPQKINECNIQNFKINYDRLKYMTDIPYGFTNNENVNKGINIILKGMGNLMKNPVIKYPLQYAQDIYGYTSKIGAEKARKDAALYETCYKK